MKRVISLIVIIFCAASMAKAQDKVLPNKPFIVFTSNPGWITINDLSAGVGLAGKAGHYSNYFIGLTSVYAYQLNKNLIMGAGAGLSFYESGVLFPLFLDFRFAFNFGRYTPYAFADGGLLLNFSHFDWTNLFINPGFGVRYALRSNFALNLAAGFHTQADGTIRESFVNIKFGMIYMFKGGM